MTVWAGIAQCIQGLATGWTVRGSNPSRFQWPSNLQQSLAGIVGLYPSAGMDVCVVCSTVQTMAPARTIRTKTSKEKVQRTRGLQKKKKKSWWRQDFPHPSRLALRSIKSLWQQAGFFWGGERGGGGGGVALTNHPNLALTLKKE